MKMILDIDKDHNGFVTQTEIDDILKIVYPEKLGMGFADADLKPIYRLFVSSANRVLVNYKLFRRFLASRKSKRPGVLTEKSVRKLDGVFEANVPDSVSEIKSVLSLNLHPKSIVERASQGSYHKVKRFNLVTHSNSVEKVRPDSNRLPHI
jgi:hypothetical protein